VDIKVSQSSGSKASLADVGLMVPSHERGFQKSSRALALSACSSNPFISTRRVETQRLLGVFECVFITAVPNTELCAWGKEDSGGHVL
jgi:hypothetical protein